MATAAVNHIVTALDYYLVHLTECREPLAEVPSWSSCWILMLLCSTLPCGTGHWRCYVTISLRFSGGLRTLNA